MSGASPVIVVGAGSAGCLVATRLARAGHEVLLLEAGPDLRGQEPAGLRDGWNLYREHAWGYTSEPDASGATANVLRTRLVGGNGWLTRFALRNHPGDYELWDGLIGGGWSHPEVLDAFNAIEHDLEYAESPWHGRQGPIPVTRYPEVEPTPFDRAVQQGMRECGLEPVPDLNRPGAVGYGRMPMNSVAGRRVTTVDLLDEAPANLELRADCMAADLVVEDGRVRAVRLVDGAALSANTVVLASGVYGSPCLLLRSGIGPAHELAELDIPVQVDLPGVGRNLCDHPAVSLDLGHRGVQRPGPVLHTVATFTSPYGTPPVPDLAWWTSDPEGDPAEGWLDVVLLSPAGRGRVALASREPEEQPRIWLPILEEVDVDTLTHGVARGLELLATPTLRELCAEPPSEVPTDPDARRAWVRADAYSVPHTVGTCAMGASPASGAVVDAAGRVHGVGGVYVADASVLPGPPTGFPHLVALMMASRITDGLVR